MSPENPFSSTAPANNEREFVTDETGVIMSPEELKQSRENNDRNNP